MAPSPKRARKDTLEVSLLQFTPDVKAVAYVIAQHGAGNLWVRPLDRAKGTVDKLYLSAH